MIDWTHVQPALARAGYYTGKLDGDDGPLTWAGLFALAAGRAPDPVLRALGAEAAKSLASDAAAATPQRLAELLAQTSHETGDYTRFVEDLRYSAAALQRTWPHRFDATTAQACVGKPAEIACRVYGGRMGNGAHPGSADGWTYRGRGMLQLTGRDNYRAFGQLVGLPLEAQPDLAADPADSLRIALAFWRRGQVNAAVDAGDFAGARRITNVGNRYAKDGAGKLVMPIGLDDVAARRARLLTVLAK